MSTAEVAAELGVTPERVLALIKAKRLPAQKIGRTWVIDSDDIERVRDRKPGRPNKEWRKGGYKDRQ